MFFRICRDGEFKTVTIEQLTPQERRDVLKSKDNEYLQKVLDRCCECLKLVDDRIER